MSDLYSIFSKYGCDKGAKHRYDQVYGPEFEALRNEPIKILEVGIFRGESMRAWLEFFPNATVYGIDIFTRVEAKDLDVLNHERVKWLKADSTKAIVRTLIDAEWGEVEFDIIIDDGLHTPLGNADTFTNLFPYIKDGGSFYVEDVWPLDIMTQVEMNHPWIKKYPERYNMTDWEVFEKAINKQNYSSIKRFDNRIVSGQGDSYIIKVKK